jgi:hypothetical protein
MYGNPESTTRVAVVGDSKVSQYLPALELLAEQNDWRLTVLTKSACSFSSAAVPGKDGTPNQSCVAWNAAVLNRLVTEEKPDYVITSQVAPKGFAEDGSLTVDAMVAGMHTSWSAVTATGAEVIVIADNANPGMVVYECVDKNRDALSKCTFSRDRRSILGGYSTQVLAVQGQDGVKMIDVFDSICPSDPCAPVIGNVLVYRQGSHLTATYVKTMTSRIAEALTSIGLKTTYRPTNP